MAELKLKQYMFTFTSGGWNTVWAKTKRGAIKAAIKKYEDSPTLNPIPSSFVIATDERLKVAMNNFW